MLTQAFTATLTVGNDMVTACICRVADLARLYALCARIQALEPLKIAFRDYIGRTGLALVLDEEKVCLF